jgi:hypothetical protein
MVVSSRNATVVNCPTGEVDVPTTVTGILLYIFSLFPGFAFQFARDGHRPVAKRSLLRETGTVVLVGLALKDGGWLQGDLFAFDNSPDPEPHRTITLTGELQYRAPGAATLETVVGFGLVIVEAQDISTVFVAYVKKQDVAKAPAGPRAAGKSSTDTP